MEVPERGVPTLFIILPIQIAVGILLVIALLYGQRDLIILTLLVLGVVNGARLWARMSLSGIHYGLTIDKQKAFPGEKIIIKLSTENAKLLPIWLQLKVPIGNLLRRSSGERALTKEGSLLWYQRSQFQWELTAEQRGVYQLGPLHILAGDLFSFFLRHKRTEEFYSLIVYPRLVTLKSIPLPRLDFFGVPRAKSPVQDPIYILGTRDYQNGQPAKFIHWKASARQNRLQEKVFESTQQEKILLIVNVDSFMKLGAEEDFERTLEVVASMAVRLDQLGHSVGLVVNGIVKGGGPTIVPIGRHYQQLPAILEVLARLQMKSNRDIEDIFHHGFALSWGVSCVYFSHKEDKTVFLAKEYFANRKIPVVFFVCHSHLPAGEDRPVVQCKIYQMDELCIK